MPTLPTSESTVRNPGQKGQPAGKYNRGAVEKGPPAAEGSFHALPEPWVPPSGGSHIALPRSFTPRNHERLRHSTPSGRPLRKTSARPTTVGRSCPAEPAAAFSGARFNFHPTRE